ncbi:MAG: hypothetical protein D6797_04070 [Bdellovibrio sp.]|nr:MAG: hypothetical protein D6797_04070 [Bdellovibrio sp.]
MKYFLFLVFLFNAIILRAQIDPSTSILLRGSDKSLEDEYFNSKRFQVKPQPKKAKKKQSVEAFPSSSKDKQNFNAYEKQKARNGSGEEKKKNMSSANKELEKNAVNVEERLDFKDLEKIIDIKKIAQEVKKTILGGSEEKVFSYRNFLEKTDPRNNVVEVSLYPMIYYTDSSSSYWYHRYSLRGPGFGGDAQVWVTPFLGVRLSFLSSLGGQIREAVDKEDRILAEEKWYGAGVRIRRVFGLSQMSKSLTYGLDYFEYNFNVLKTADNRVGLKVMGPRLNMNLEWPKTKSFYWLMGVEALIGGRSQEVKTALDLKSGEISQTFMVGFSFGGKMILSRQKQLFWKVSHRMIQTFYSGKANHSDPLSGQTPSGVDVTQGTSWFTIGVTWGN